MPQIISFDQTSMASDRIGKLLACMKSFKRPALCISLLSIWKQEKMYGPRLSITMGDRWRSHDESLVLALSMLSE